MPSSHRLFRENLIDVTSALDAVESDLALLFYLTPYPVITCSYAIVVLIPFHFLCIERSEHIIKLGNFLKNQPSNLFSVMLRQSCQVLKERFLIEAGYHTMVSLGFRNIS